MTRLPTKTYGNCLLGFHCSQKAGREAAPVLDFSTLRASNSKCHPQIIHKGLWMFWGQFVAIRNT